MNFFKSVTSHALGPPPSVTNCHTFLDPSPLERDVLYGRPLIAISKSSLHQSYLRLFAKQLGRQTASPYKTYVSQINKNVIANCRFYSTQSSRPITLHNFNQS